MVKKILILLIIVLGIFLVYQFWPVKNTVRMPSLKTKNQGECMPVLGGLLPVCRGLWGQTSCLEKIEIGNKEPCLYCERKCYGLLTYEIPKFK